MNKQNKLFIWPHVHFATSNSKVITISSVKSHNGPFSAAHSFAGDSFLYIIHQRRPWLGTGEVQNDGILLKWLCALLEDE